MPAHKKWPVWIQRSVRKHFDDNRQGLTMFAEGEIRKTGDVKDFIELRTDGPYLTLLSKGYWKLYVEINVLLQSAMDETNNDRIHTNVGIVSAAFTELLRILKYGSDAEDDDSLLGCMELLGDVGARERIQISHFGRIDPSVPLLQASVEGHYKMTLRE